MHAELRADRGVMSIADQAHAFAILGLAPGASRSQIDAAYAKLMAFTATEGSQNKSIRGLVAAMRAEFDAAYKMVEESASADSKGTASSISASQSGKISRSTRIFLAWMAGIVIVCGFLYSLQHLSPLSPAPDAALTPQQTEPAQPPDFALPFIHDDLKFRAVRWTSGWESEDAARVMVVWAYTANNDPLFRIELYSSGGHWREQRQYVIRYAADRLQVDVQRFQEQVNVPVLQDRSNVSTVGDVLVQTTTYKYAPSTKLESVEVHTPFNQAADGMRLHRDKGQLFVERITDGSVVNITSGMKWLNDRFDLWTTFGEPNI